MSKISLLILAAALAVTSAQTYQSRASLYANTGGTGAFVQLPTSSYANDLSTYGFNNKAYSTCQTGTWLFYDIVNFNSGGNSAMEYIFEPSYTCVNFQNLGGYVSSAKFVGSASDYRSSSLTFYETTYFQGAEEYATTDLPNLNLNGAISSLIITGTGEWTVYDRPNYAGNGICLVPQQSPDYMPAFVPDTLDIEPVIPHGTIASVRKGCFSAKVAKLATSKRGSFRSVKKL